MTRYGASIGGRIPTPLEVKWRRALEEIRDGAPATDYPFSADDDAIVPMNIAREALQSTAEEA